MPTHMRTKSAAKVQKKMRLCKKIAKNSYFLLAGMPWVENQYGRGMDDNRDNVPLAINGFASGEGLKSTMKTMRINNIDNEDKASDAESCLILC